MGAALFLLGKIEDCIELLTKTERVSEAAFLARSYMPSMIPKCIKLWKDDLKNVSEDAAKALADSEANADFFPELQTALQVEKLFLQNRSTFVSSTTFPTAKDQLQFDLLDMVKTSPDVLVSTEPRSNQNSPRTKKSESEESKNKEEQDIMKQQLEEEKRREKLLQDQRRQEEERLENDRKAQEMALLRENEEKKARELAAYEEEQKLQ